MRGDTTSFVRALERLSHFEEKLLLISGMAFLNLAWKAGMTRKTMR